MFSLLIKGTIVDAERALVLHGFHPSDWLSQPIMAVSTQAHTACIVNVTDETEPGVTRWFAELPSLAPFPVGTLLHYTHNNKAARFLANACTCSGAETGCECAEWCAGYDDSIDP